MSIKIESGLFNLDFIDHHAILGIPVDVDPKEIRKQYLKLARRLHPDSCAKESEADRQRASEILAKLVNPAYEQLSQEKNFNEYAVLLKLKGQQALRQQETVLLSSDAARRLAGATGEIDTAYRTAVQQLAEQQYQQLDQALQITGQISELNLIYLMRKASKGDMSPTSGTAATKTSASPKTGSAPAISPSQSSGPPTKASILSSYLRRAQEYESKQDFTNAVRELRDALKIDPNNSTVHSRLGVVYLRSNQATMAKVHFRKALELNPQDATAMEGMRRVDPGSNTSAASKPDPKATKDSPTAGKPASKDKPESGGGLFGLFGKKK
jgi:curved DNA-binding protein CbpA